MKLFFNRWLVMIEFIIIFRCSATSRTPMLSPDTPWNDTATLNISSCDIGRLGIYIRSPDYPKDPRAELVSIFKFCQKSLDYFCQPIYDLFNR